MSQFTPTERTKIRRKPERGSYDRELIYRILDEAFVCHLGFIADGLPFVVPTNYVRVGDKLFLHGKPLDENAGEWRAILLECDAARRHRLRPVGNWPFGELPLRRRDGQGRTG